MPCAETGERLSGLEETNPALAAAAAASAALFLALFLSPLTRSRRSALMMQVLSMMSTKRGMSERSRFCTHVYTVMNSLLRPRRDGAIAKNVELPSPAHVTCAKRG